MPPGPELKKRKSGAETPTLARDQRDILPKPTHPNNNSPSMTTMSSSPAPSSSQKKRGRPSKADQERRQKEAMDRGEILPPGPVASSVGLQGPDDFRPHPSPVTILPAPRPSQTAVTPGHMLSPQIAMERGPSPTMGSEATVRKRKPKPPAKPKAQKSLEHQFLINTPAGPAGQEETMLTPVSTAAPQAGSMAAPPEAGNPPASTAPTITQDQARMEQPQPENK
ncbi:hypothetical protein NA56DRAFT_32570 [Hyaloscypha hepaticicola]|uniref:Uncharacterized protein n=1 Tax=Hyaloscypha hepaticicola TaxID=2082293 RepID=A0A2J6QDE6_9HELO|nr:hypothetical protein NA56DRAFT_32570 [Hyaloscypha hepaticicola]